MSNEINKFNHFELMQFGLTNQLQQFEPFFFYM